MDKNEEDTIIDKSTKLCRSLKALAKSLAVVLYRKNVGNTIHYVNSIGYGSYLILPPNTKTRFKVGDFVIVKNRRCRSSPIMEVWDVELNSASMEEWYDAREMHVIGDVYVCLQTDGSIRCVDRTNGNQHCIGKPAIVWPAGSMRWMVDGLSYKRVSEYVTACGDRITNEEKMILALRYGDYLPSNIVDLIDEDYSNFRASQLSYRK